MIRRMANSIRDCIHSPIVPDLLLFFSRIEEFLFEVMRHSVGADVIARRLTIFILDLRRIEPSRFSSES